MRIATKQQISRHQGGFAIVVVLSSLLILTALFAIASQRSMGHIQTQSAERHLAQSNAENAAILAILLDLGPDNIPAETLQLPPPLDETTIYIQDVGGLIDINTASPELLEVMFLSLDFPSDAASDLRTWRREGRRLFRVDDLIRITDVDLAFAADLNAVTTVFSGRRGIAPEHAPAGVLQILNNAGTAGQDEFTSPPSNTNFAIYRDGGLIGTVSFSGPPESWRVLDVR